MSIICQYITSSSLWEGGGGVGPTKRSLTCPPNKPAVDTTPKVDLLGLKLVRWSKPKLLSYDDESSSTCARSRSTQTVLVWVVATRIRTPISAWADRAQLIEPSLAWARIQSPVRARWARANRKSNCIRRPQREEASRTWSDPHPGSAPHWRVSNQDILEAFKPMHGHIV